MAITPGEREELAKVFEHAYGELYAAAEKEFLSTMVDSYKHAY